MSISTAILIASAATVVSAEWTNTWWTPSSAMTSTSVWSASSSAPAWTPSSESVWTPSSSTAESAWAPSATPSKPNVSIVTSYTNTVYVTKATTATQTVDCGKGTMIYGNAPSHASGPTIGVPSKIPTDLPSDWTKAIMSSVLPPQISASGGFITTNCANASTTYTYTYTPSGGKPKKTSSIAETPSEPTEPAHPIPPSAGGDRPATAPEGGDDDSSSSNSHKGKPSSGFSTGDDMDSAASRQDIANIGAIFTLGAVAVAAFML